VIEMRMPPAFFSAAGPHMCSPEINATALILGPLTPSLQHDALALQSLLTCVHSVTVKLGEA
ncbi:MAG: hypothetical protein ACR2PG_05570, partial [Hyphomicrobiaceae bacterium]